MPPTFRYCSPRGKKRCGQASKSCKYHPKKTPKCRPLKSKRKLTKVIHEVLQEVVKSLARKAEKKTSWKWKKAKEAEVSFVEEML